MSRHATVRHVVLRPVKRVGDRVAERVLNPSRLKRLRAVPSLPHHFRRRFAAIRGPWPEFEREIPSELRGVVGIRRDVVEEDRAFNEEPLHSFHHNYPTSVMWALARLWQSLVPVGPRLMRAIASAQETGGHIPDDRRRTESPGEVTSWVRAEAAEIGISTVGVAEYDPRYTFVDLADEVAGDTVIVCILEQNWHATQLLPGPVSEQTALSTNAELIEMAASLATRLQARGYRARAHTTEGVAIVQHYAVQAGLGQLGYNGQLLTPQAGSRCRITLITTEAPLEHDRPRDFGVPALCDRCRACVRRCPAGAIPNRPAMHRGVEKVKLNLSRCFPVVAQVHGCSVCMKVCPVQRYGLTRVVDHYEATGDILGTGTDELEGYDWPLDGRHYGPAERPFLEPAFFDVPGFGRLSVAEPDKRVTENPLM